MLVREVFQKRRCAKKGSHFCEPFCSVQQIIRGNWQKEPLKISAEVREVIEGVVIYIEEIRALKKAHISVSLFVLC